MPPFLSTTASSTSRTIENAASLLTVAFVFRHLHNKWQLQQELADLILSVDNKTMAQTLPQGFHDRAAALLAKSLLNTPSYVSICKGTEETRFQQLQWLFLRNIAALASVSPTPDIQLWCKLEKKDSKVHLVASAMLVHCDYDFSLWDYLTNGFLKAPCVFGISGIKRMFKIKDWIEEREEKVRNGRPCMTLQRMGVLAEMQGKGIGSSFLKEVLENNPNNHLPCLLSTQERRNVTFYSRLGFQVMMEDKYEDEDPEHSFTSWVMWREPQME